MGSGGRRLLAISLCVGTLGFGVSHAQPAQPFSVESLDGTYRVVIDSDDPDEPLGGTGTITFDGDGGLSGKQTMVDRDGPRDETITGHYEVNPDGSGDMTTTITYHRPTSPSIPFDPRTSTVSHLEYTEFRIIRQTGEIRFRQVDPDPDVSGRMRKR